MIVEAHPLTILVRGRVEVVHDAPIVSGLNAEPEVADLEGHIDTRTSVFFLRSRVHEDVLRLHVAVDDAPEVQEHEAARDLKQPGRRIPQLRRGPPFLGLWVAAQPTDVFLQVEVLSKERDVAPAACGRQPSARDHDWDRVAGFNGRHIRQAFEPPRPDGPGDVLVVSEEGQQLDLTSHHVLRP